MKSALTLTSPLFDGNASSDGVSSDMLLDERVYESVRRAARRAGVKVCVCDCGKEPCQCCCRLDCMEGKKLVAQLSLQQLVSCCCCCWRLSLRHSRDPFSLFCSFSRFLSPSLPPPFLLTSAAARPALLAVLCSMCLPDSLPFSLCFSRCLQRLPPFAGLSLRRSLSLSLSLASCFLLHSTLPFAVDYVKEETGRREDC